MGVAPWCCIVDGWDRVGSLTVHDIFRKYLKDKVYVNYGLNSIEYMDLLNFYLACVICENQISTYYCR